MASMIQFKEPSPPPSPRQTKVLFTGVRWTLLAINAFLMVTGMAMVILGIKVKEHLVVPVQKQGQLADLWWLGMMPLSIGFVGLVSAVVGQPKWLGVWIVYCVVSGVGSYIFFIISGCFDPSAFGVNLRIYGRCYQDARYCKCVWESGGKVSVTAHTCASIRYVTAAYLSEVALLTLCLAAAVIGCVLACVTACCIKHCIIIQAEDEKTFVHSTFQSETTLHPGPSPSCMYMSEIITPNTTRSLLSVPSRKASML